jgi:hypothetical protein
MRAMYSGLVKNLSSVDLSISIFIIHQGNKQGLLSYQMR